jgi:hypothetical protein
MKKILFILCLFSMTAHAEEVTPMEGVTIIENPKETNPLRKRNNLENLENLET